MFKKLSPKNIIFAFKRIYFTFSQTIRLVWMANPRWLAVAFLVNIISGIIVFPTLYLEKLIIDAIVKNIGNPIIDQAVRTLALLFLARITLQIINSVLSRISNMSQWGISRIFSAHIDVLIGQKISELDIETIDDPVFRDKFNKIEREGGRRTWGLAMPLLQIPNYFFSLLSGISILFIFNPLIGLIVFLLAIPEFIFDAVLTKKEYELETIIAYRSRIWGWLNNYLRSTRSFVENKILNLSPYFLKRLKSIQDEIYKERLVLQKQRTIGGLAVFLPQNIFTFFLSLYLGVLTIAQTITLGSFQMYLRAVNSFSSSLTGLMGSILDLYENYLFVTDFVWFLNLKPVISSGNKTISEKSDLIIEFKNVWFRYKEDQDWILKDINLSISPKENLAIVGENGAGKTTLIRLLCRLYEPQKGEILINSVNLKEYNRRNLWDNFAVLLQDFEGYPFTARESIGYGRVEQVNDLESIMESAKKASIDEFINTLPLKYENPLAPEFEKGIRPSGGQWQRIGLARVLFRNAPVTILDEPTSNVDPKSEEEIFDKIINFAKNRNLILISHRFSTVRRADKIAVMDKGKIVEYGSHDELMKKKGLYEELFSLQAKAYK